MKLKFPRSSTSDPMRRLAPSQFSSLEKCVSISPISVKMIGTYANRVHVIPAWTWTLDTTSLKLLTKSVQALLPGVKTKQEPCKLLSEQNSTAGSALTARVKAAVMKVAIMLKESIFGFVD